MFGYGEDALTIWVLGCHLSKLLTTLHDDSRPEDAVVLYRPSFGRRGTQPDATDPALFRAAFGEFDAIIGTTRSTYLIEAKWSSSSEVRKRGATLRLQASQVRRHEIMGIYIDEWRTMSPDDWASFTQSTSLRKRLTALSASPPHPRTQLARSLESALRLLKDCGPARDILLLLRTDSGSPPGGVIPHRFRLVGVDCRVPAEGGGYFLLPFSNPGTPPPMWRSPVFDFEQSFAEG